MHLWPGQVNDFVLETTSVQNGEGERSGVRLGNSGLSLISPEYGITFLRSVISRN
jgi:hypothetical protein